MDLKDVVALNVRRLRHEHGLTQEALADRVELSARYISKIETGAASPTVSVVGRLAGVFKVDPCELLRRGAKASDGRSTDRGGL
jgi:transcriptional regulator with XRE-family HTH domain